MNNITRQRGLTLLEMMVVLLIASMAITLGFQSLSLWQRANAAISNVSGNNQQMTLTESWLKSSLGSLIPLKELPFEGDATRLKGVTVQAVQSHQGGATDIQWNIDEKTAVKQLQLDEDGAVIQLPLPGAISVSFSYLDKTGKSHSQWPPKLGLHDQLPAAIMLRQEMDDGSIRLWATAIVGLHNPRFNPFELELD